jgi:hypothetical protein
MRVMVQERSTPTLGPCDVYGYGGVKDFGISVNPAGPPSPVGSILLVMYTDASCGTGAVKFAGSNATWGSAVSAYTGGQVNFNVNYSGGSAVWTIAAGDSYSLYVDDSFQSFQLGLVNEKRSNFTAAAYTWQISVPKSKISTCTALALPPIASYILINV